MTLTPPEISISADIKVGKQPPVEAAARQLETHLNSQIKRRPPFCHLAPLENPRLFVAVFLRPLASNFSSF